MPCPFFVPEAPLPRGTGPHLGRVPLGEVHTGRCGAGATVDPATAIEICNFGYARGRCAAFPAGAEWDAVRFSAPRDSFADVVEIVWVGEREYSPARHGRFRFCRQQRDLLDPPDDEILHAQALAFALEFAGA